MMTIESVMPIDAAKDDVLSQTAHRIAAEVRRSASLGETKLVKVTSLLKAFGIPGSLTRISDVRRHLAEHGVSVDSGWHNETGQSEIRRPGLLSLSMADRPDVVDARSERDETILMSVWGSRRIVRERPLPELYEKPSPSDVLWFNIEPPEWPEDSNDSRAMNPESSTRSKFKRRRPRNEPASQSVSVNGKLEKRQSFDERVREVKHRLADWCPGLEEEMVRDLLRQDVQPKVETYGHEHDGVRGVSVVAVIARETPGREDDSDGISEELVFQMVEIIVGDGWIITCWHPSRIFTGVGEALGRHSLLREPYMARVAQRWLSDGSVGGRDEQMPKSSGDAGAYLARALVDTYAASHRMMELWVAAWEADFYSCLSSPDKEGKAERLKGAANEISSLLSMVGEFRRRLTAFQLAPSATPDHSWFPGITRRADDPAELGLSPVQSRLLAEAVEAAAASMELLANNIRGMVNLLMLQASATQQESTERLQGYLGKVTGLVLVPTLVAGLFGANTRLPGGGSWMGFELMIVLMVLSAMGV